MWYCSLCNLDLGEISALGNENDHPTCPYCHGAVEEEGTVLVEVIETASKVGWNDRDERILANAAERSARRLFDIIVRSLDDSPYSDYRDDIEQIIRSAFEPQAKKAYAEIAALIVEDLRSAEPRFVP